MGDELRNIRNLVGAVTKEELRYVDSFVSDDVGLFMPVGGACFYALTPLHSHPSYMFVLAFDENTSVKIGDRVITAKRGKVFTLAPGIAHHELASDSAPRYIAVFIEKVFFERELSSYPRAEKGLGPEGEFFDAPANLLPLLKQFMLEAGSKLPGSEAVLKALSLEVCHSIIRGISGIRLSDAALEARMEVNRTIEYMHNNLSEKITVKDLSGIACISPSHFSRIFKKEVGCTPMDYLNRIRLERVKKLLLAGDKSVTDIALECGFGSPAYLSSSFRRAFRMRPRDYLVSFKKGAISKKNKRIVKD